MRAVAAWHAVLLSVLLSLLLGACSGANTLTPSDGGGGRLPDLVSSGARSDAGSDLGGANPGGSDAGGGARDAGPKADAAPGTHDYGHDGPTAVTVANFTVKPASGASFGVVVYVPGGSAPCPVVVLSSGLQQPAAAYAPYGKRLASWGMITIERDDPGVGTQTSAIVDNVGYLVSTWLPAQNADGSSALHGRVDLTHVGLAGHSRGGQVSLLAAEGPLAGKTRGVFGLDPVDSTMAGATAARTQLGSIGVPTAFLGETTDGSGASACAPSADNFQVLYAAAPSPSVALTALGADHTQFEDPASCSLCFLCTAGSAQAATVLDYSVRYLTAFFARELEGDASVDAALGSAADVAAALVTVESK